jgi:hypothetical protein
MTAARVASPEGWQVSVPCSLIGVEREALMNEGGDVGPLAEERSAPSRDPVSSLGVVLGVHCWGRGEQC